MASRKETFLEEGVTETRFRFLLTRLRPPNFTADHPETLTFFYACCDVAPPVSFLLGRVSVKDSLFPLFHHHLFWHQASWRGSLSQHCRAFEVSSCRKGHTGDLLWCGAPLIAGMPLGLWTHGHRAMKWTKLKSVFRVNVGELRKSASSSA